MNTVNDIKNSSAPFKQHYIKLYIMLPCGHQGWTYVNADKCKALKNYLPTREMLETHFEIQYILRQKAINEKSRFRPMPLFLEVENTIFVDACDELIHNFPNIRKEELYAGIALTLGASIPCTIITAQK